MLEDVCTPEEIAEIERRREEGNRIGQLLWDINVAARGLGKFTKKSDGWSWYHIWEPLPGLVVTIVGGYRQTLTLVAKIGEQIVCHGTGYRQGMRVDRYIPGSWADDSALQALLQALREEATAAFAARLEASRQEERRKALEAFGLE